MVPLLRAALARQPIAAVRGSRQPNAEHAGPEPRAAFDQCRARLPRDHVTALPRPGQHPGNVWSLHGYHERLARLGRNEQDGIAGNSS